MSMNNYIQQKKIGEGAFGKAWLVLSKQDKVNYVIKEINTARMPPKEREDAKKEVSVLAQMQHPNIVKYRESFEERGNLHIVMEYCDGGDLYVRINTQNGVLFHEDQVLDWFVQISLALKHMHDKKILHRDIKCQNIFLTKDGRVKLGDFGIVKVLNSTTELARTCVGTPYYLSPEICENKPYNNKSDIWSLGCVLYELTTLKHAFEAGNMKNLVLKIIRGTYPPVPPKYSNDLRSLIAQLFKRNASDRPNINAILRRPFLQRRIERFLDAEHLRLEFGQAFRPVSSPHSAVPGRNKVNPPRTPVSPSPYGAILKRPKPSPSPSPMQPLQKRREMVPAGPVKPPSPTPMMKEEADRKRYLMQRKAEMERKMRQKREEMALAKQQKELSDKQKQAMLHEAREAGWRNILLGNNDDKSHESEQLQQQNHLSPSPGMRHVFPPAAVAPSTPPNARYAHYYEKLDLLKQQQQQGDAAERAAKMGGPGVYYQFNRAKYMGDAADAPSAAAGAEHAAQGEYAANRARVVEDYLHARYIAAKNKARENNGVAALIGGGRPTAAANERNRQEEEYLARLQKIREQNFLHRRDQLPYNMNAACPREPEAAVPREDAENRRLMIERLKRQSEEKRKILEEHLHLKKQMEINARQAVQHAPMEVDNNKKDDRPLFGKRPPVVPVGPAPSITAVMQKLDGGDHHPSPSSASPPPPSITTVLNKISVPMATPPTPSSGQPIRKQVAAAVPLEDYYRGADESSESMSSRISESAEKLSKQKKKEGILKRLNAKAAAIDRSRWEAPKDVDSTDFSCGQTPSFSEAGGVEASSSTSDNAPPPMQPRKAWAGGDTGVKLPDIWSNKTLLSPGSTTTTTTITNTGVRLESNQQEQGNNVAFSMQTFVLDSFSAVQSKGDNLSIIPEASMEVDAESSRQSKPVEVKNQRIISQVEFIEMEDLTREEGQMRNGLSTGRFDLPDTELLRTCSLPDLNSSKLVDSLELEENASNQNNTNQMGGDSMVHKSDPMSSEVDKSSSTPFRKVSYLQDRYSRSRSSNSTEEDSSAVKMNSLVHRSPIKLSNSSHSRKQNGSVSDSHNHEEEADNSMEEDPEEEESECSTDEGEESAIGAAVEEEDEDLESIRQSMLQMLNSSPDSEDAADHYSNSTKFSNCKNNRGPPAHACVERSSSSGGDEPGDDVETSQPEDWEDNEDDDFGDGEDDSSHTKSDIFLRLEKARMELEAELGFDMLMKAYQAIQALQEDEDESASEGAAAVRKFLGNKANSYERILQLVLADGVFLEDD